MKEEEIQRTIEFIVQQQAQYAVGFEKDESRLEKLEEYFKMLVELARGADERQDTLSETIATLRHTMNELVQRMIVLAEAQARTEATVAELVRVTDERLDHYASRLARDESGRAKLEESFTMLVELAHRH